jgi:hypothetical protein
MTYKTGFFFGSNFNYRIQSMEDSIQTYHTAGIKKIVSYKNDFASDNLQWLYDTKNAQKKNPFEYSNLIDHFVNTFCEYELADSDYMSIHLEANQYNTARNSFSSASLENILKHLTYIIWTDRVVEGYLPAKIKDQTLYHLLDRLSQLGSTLTPVAA